MKVIDLLNKIANEEVRHDIKINTRNYYCSIEEYLKKFGISEDTLNVEVIGFDDIIEEDKKIRKLDFIEENTFSKRQNGMTNEDRRLLDSNFKELGIKINEIIDYLEENKND